MNKTHSFDHMGVLQIIIKQRRWFVHCAMFQLNDTALPALINSMQRKKTHTLWMMDRRKLKPPKCVTGVYHLVTNLLLSVFRICDLFGSCLNIEIAAEHQTLGKTLHCISYIFCFWSVNCKKKLGTYETYSLTLLRMTCVSILFLPTSCVQHLKVP